MEITEKIKSFEDACEQLGITTQLPDLSAVADEKIRRSTLAFIKIATIVKALNEGWEPDWEDISQYKYYPWFYVENAGLVCAYAYNAVTATNAGIGSRLGYKTRALAEYAGTQFKDLYQEMLL